MSLNKIRGKNRSFIRSILRYTTHVKFDRQGRVQIPDILLEYAGINKDVEIKTYEKGVERVMLSCASGSTAVVFHLYRLLSNGIRVHPSLSTTQPIHVRGQLL